MRIPISPKAWMASSLAAALLVWAPRARAADPSSADSATAQALFDQAKKLMAEGNYPDACPKLEESQRLDPGVGTLLNLADCFEQEGRTATAWSKFLEAASAAKEAGQLEREQGARERAAALVPRISKIVITVTGADKVPGLEVKRDGALVGPAQWGSPIPADQGLHTISATAPGRKSWETKIMLKGGGATLTALVPELEALGSTASSANGTSTDTTAPRADVVKTDGSGLGTQRALGLVAGGVGVVGVVLSTVFGVTSKSKHDEALSHCDGAACRDQQGVDLKNSARTAGTISTVAFVVGAAGLAGGGVLWFTAKPVSAGTRVGLGLGSVLVQGTW